MKTKLTLTIEKNTLERAKQYSKRNRKSLSALVENFFSEISHKGQRDSIVKSTKGILKDSYPNLSDKEIRDIIYKEKYGV